IPSADSSRSPSRSLRFQRCFMFFRPKRRRVPWRCQFALAPSRRPMSVGTRPAQSHRDGVVDWNYWAGDPSASLKVVGDEREIGKTGGDKSARNQIKPVGTRKSFGFQTMTCLQLARIREKVTGQENNRDSKERGDDQQLETGSITTMPE